MGKEKGMKRMVAHAMLGIILLSMIPAVIGAQGGYKLVNMIETNGVTLGRE